MRNAIVRCLREENARERAKRREQTPKCPSHMLSRCDHYSYRRLGRRDLANNGIVIDEHELPEGEEFRDEEHPAAMATSPCPACGRSIYADAERCPSCGDYVVPGARGLRRRPAWWWIAFAVVLAVLLAWAFGRG